EYNRIHNSPEARAAKAKYVKLRDKLFKS
ncbi:hypothetical protein LCGC14_1370120, partial [marine sediment metagenome]